MKKNMIGLLLAIVMASSAIGTVPALAAETTVYNAQEDVDVEKEPPENAENGSTETENAGIGEVDEDTTEAEYVEKVEEESEQELTEESEESNFVEETEKAEDAGTTEEAEEAEDAGTTEEAEEAEDAGTTEEAEEAEKTNVAEETESAEDTEEESADTADSAAEISEDKETITVSGEQVTESNEKEAANEETGNIEDSGTCGENATWTVIGSESDISLIIRGTGNMNDYSGEDMPWSAYSAGITSVKVEEGITSLGSYSFYSFANLVQVSLPETLEVINDYCFANCSSLLTISIPKSITEIKSYAFEGCGLKEVYFSGSESEWNNIEIGQGNEVLATVIDFQVDEETTPVIELSQDSFVYNGEIQKPEVTVKVNDEVIDAENYSVEYSGDCINVGTYDVQITLKREYEGKAVATFVISPKAITPEVILSKTSFTYDGKVHKPILSVSDGDCVLQSSDYEVNYSKGLINVGTYKVKVTLKGNYSGTKTLSYRITAKKVTPTVTLNKSTYVYTGNNIKPATTVKIGKTILKNNQDYTVIYPKVSKNAGTYKVTVKLKGNYSGTKTLSFKITAKKITPAVALRKSIYVYTGNNIKPATTVKIGKTILKNNQDYTVIYPKVSKNAGTYKVTVKLKGNYSGTKTLSFKITAKKITPAVALRKSIYVYTGNNIKPVTTVKIGKTLLKINQDYTVIYPKACKNVGTYKATVKLKGNYSGSRVVSYKINPKPTKLYSVVGTNDSFTVRWHKQTSQITGYQIQYSLKSNFASGNKVITINRNSICSKTLKKPTKGKNYFVRVRTYKTVSGKNYYSSWSGTISSITKRTLQFTDTVTLNANGDSYSYYFSITNRMIAMPSIKIKVVGPYISKGGFRIILKDANDVTWQNDYTSLEDYSRGDEYETWFYSDGGMLPPGDYYYTIINTSDDTIKVTHSTFGFTKKAATASLKKSVTVRSGSWVKLGKITDGLPLVKSIKCTDRNIIDGWDIEHDGTVYVWAEKKGTSKVVITLASGKKFSTKLNVTAGPPNFMAYVNGYYTRDNYFTVKIKNLRGSDLTIIREGGKVENYDYKSFDRWFVNNGNVTIKSGETKTVRFYLKGTPTYPDYKDFDLHAKFIFEGKTYVWHVWRNDSAFKMDNGWYDTYWDEEAYDEWY